jgi:alanine dehydrogenase
MPIFLSNTEQEQCITPREAIEALENGLRQLALGDGVRRPRIDNILPTVRDGEWFNFSSMEGGIREPGYYALRIKPDIYSFPVVNGAMRTVTYSYKPGLYGGMVFLYKVDNAEFLALMNDGFVQHLRVAASASLGVKYLSRPESRVLGIVGSGGMARFFANAIPAVRPIERIQVWSPNKDNLDAYVAEMRGKVDAEVVPVDGVEQVARKADIVCLCTTARQPVLKAEWLEPGAHLNHVTHMEFGPDVLARVDTVGLLVRRTPIRTAGFVDDDFALSKASFCYIGGRPEERARYPRGVPTPDRYAGKAVVDCVDWRSGKRYERKSANEITLLANASYGTLEGEALHSAGTQGVQFAAVGGKIYENACKQGLGTILPREMFLQDIPT